MYAVPSASTVSHLCISTLVVDDCPEFRRSLKHLLDLSTSTHGMQFQIVGQAMSLQQTMDLATQYSPTLILLDLELGDDSGIDVLQWLRSRNRQNRILVLSEQRDGDSVFKAMQAGAKGYLFKHQISTHLLEAVQVILQDQIYLPPDVATQFFQVFQSDNRRKASDVPPIHLTERERDVLYWLVQGASNEVIAKKLYITVGTVKAYLTIIFEKLNVNSRTQAALQALKLGVISA